MIRVVFARGRCLFAGLARRSVQNLAFAGASVGWCSPRGLNLRHSPGCRAGRRSLWCAPGRTAAGCSALGWAGRSQVERLLGGKRVSLDAPAAAHRGVFRATRRGAVVWCALSWAGRSQVERGKRVSLDAPAAAHRGVFRATRRGAVVCCALSRAGRSQVERLLGEKRVSLDAPAAAHREVFRATRRGAVVCCALGRAARPSVEQNHSGSCSPPHAPQAPSLDDGGPHGERTRRMTPGQNHAGRAEP